MPPKDVERMANSVDPDQTAPYKAVWSESRLFVQTYMSQYLELHVSVHGPGEIRIVESTMGLRPRQGNLRLVFRQTSHKTK